MKYKIGVCVTFVLLLCLCVMYLMFELCCEVSVPPKVEYHMPRVW